MITLIFVQYNYKFYNATMIIIIIILPYATLLRKPKYRHFEHNANIHVIQHTCTYVYAH